MKNKSEEISPEIMEALFKYGHRRNIKTHEILAHIGETSNSVYYVLSGGFLKRFYNEGSEVLRTISFHLPTHRPFMTQTDSFFSRNASYYEIKAFQNSDILVFNRSIIEQTMQETFIAEFHYKMIIDALHYENEFKARLLTYNSKQFYQYLGDEFPEIVQTVPSKYIAEFIGISAEWLSKLRQKEQKKTSSKYVDKHR